KTVADSFYDLDPSPFKYSPDYSRPGIDDGHIRSLAGRVTAQLSAKDKISYYHDAQDKVRGHWGISGSVPPEATAIEPTPTSFVSVTKWTRTHTNRLLFDGGFAFYNQEYAEIYQPSVTAVTPPLVTLSDQSTGNIAHACTGRVANWKDVNPRVGVSYDVFGNGKTAVKASVARYVAGVGLAANSITDNANPETTIGTTDTRAWRDLDLNGSPFDSSGHIQLNELTASTSTPSFGKNIPSSTLTDPAVLTGWGRRSYNWEYAVSAQHELAPRVSINGGWFRRKFGNQTVSVDNRYNFTNGSFDGPFCANAPADPNLPGGGG